MIVNPLTGKGLAAAQMPKARVNVYEGSVRSSKTIGSLIEWIRFIRRGPAGNLLMTGRTQRTIINNLLMPMQEMLGAQRVKINYGLGTADILGRTVLIVGADNEAARTKIQGLTLAGAYVDEASTLPESYWNMLVSRLSVAGAILWATCNPEGPRHWFKLKWLDKAAYWITHDGSIVDRRGDLDLPDGDEKRPIDLHRVSFILDDNPNLDADYVASVKSMYTGLWYRRMIRGEWALADGAVYEMFDPARHVVDELPPLERIVSLGVDHGATNPTRGVLVGIGVDGCLYVIAEWVPPKCTDAERSQLLRAFLDKHGWPERIFVDPSARGFRDQLRADGFTSVFAANNRVVPGITLVSSLLEADRLKIHRSCNALIDEIPGYVWDTKKAEEKGEDAVIKIDDHACDAWRYSVASSRNLWRPYVSIPTPTVDEPEEVAA